MYYDMVGIGFSNGRHHLSGNDPFGYPLHQDTNTREGFRAYAERVNGSTRQGGTITGTNPWTFNNGPVPSVVDSGRFNRSGGMVDAAALQSGAGREGPSYARIRPSTAFGRNISNGAVPSPKSVNLERVANRGNFRRDELRRIEPKGKSFNAIGQPPLSHPNSQLHPALQRPKVSPTNLSGVAPTKKIPTSMGGTGAYALMGAQMGWEAIDSSIQRFFKDIFNKKLDRNFRRLDSLRQQGYSNVARLTKGYGSQQAKMAQLYKERLEVLDKMNTDRFNVAQDADRNDAEQWFISAMYKSLPNALGFKTGQRFMNEMDTAKFQQNPSLNDPLLNVMRTSQGGINPGGRVQALSQFANHTGNEYIG
uniref:Uncharacterized protein n=1 Tax=Laksystermes virus TaxID=2796606 RepID=A0A7T7K924_9VIRU|nr:hypothetical protein 2 [Laksystermes virus]